MSTSFLAVDLAKEILAFYGDVPRSGFNPNLPLHAQPPDAQPKGILS